MNESEWNDNQGEGETGVIVKPRSEIKKPSLYRVLLLNDDYTPMDFVVHILEGIFHKNREEATTIMLAVHKKGVGVCGVYPYEIAETKAAQTMRLARQREYPLQCRLEKE